MKVYRLIIFLLAFVALFSLASATVPVATINSPTGATYIRGVYQVDFNWSDANEDIDEYIGTGHAYVSITLRATDDANTVIVKDLNLFDSNLTNGDFNTATSNRYVFSFDSNGYIDGNYSMDINISTFINALVPMDDIIVSTAHSIVIDNNAPHFNVVSPTASAVSTGTEVSGTVSFSASYNDSNGFSHCWFQVYRDSSNIRDLNTSLCSVSQVLTDNQTAYVVVYGVSYSGAVSNPTTSGTTTYDFAEGSGGGSGGGGTVDVGAGNIGDFCISNSDCVAGFGLVCLDNICSDGAIIVVEEVVEPVVLSPSELAAVQQYSGGISVPRIPIISDIIDFVLSLFGL